MDIKYKLAEAKLARVVKKGYDTDKGITTSAVRSIATIVTAYPEMYAVCATEECPSIYKFLEKYRNFIDFSKINYNNLTLNEKFTIRNRYFLDMGKVFETQKVSNLFCSKYLDVAHIPGFLRNPHITDKEKIQILRTAGLKKELILTRFPFATFAKEDNQAYHPTSIKSLKYNEPRYERIIYNHYKCDVPITRIVMIRGIHGKVFVTHGGHGYIDMIDVNTEKVDEGVTPDKVFEDAMKKV